MARNRDWIWDRENAREAADNIDVLIGLAEVAVALLRGGPDLLDALANRHVATYTDGPYKLVEEARKKLSPLYGQLREAEYEPKSS